MGTGGSYTSHILEVIIQSGKSATVYVLTIVLRCVRIAGFYCAHLLVLIITDAMGTNAFFIFLDPVRANQVMQEFLLI